MNSTEQITDFLKNKAEIFVSFDKIALVKIIEQSRIIHYAKNEIIAHAGVEASHLYVVLDGTASATFLDSKGEFKKLRPLKAGETFAELSLMTGEPLIVDLIADSSTQVLLVPRSVFQSIVMTDFKAVQYVSKKIADRFKAALNDPNLASAAYNQKEDFNALDLRAERPEKILVINCGSSSLKYAFFDTENNEIKVEGRIDRIGIDGTKHTFDNGKNRLETDVAGCLLENALELMLNSLTDRKNGVIGSLSELSLIAHRVVHGGSKFTEATLIDQEVLSELDALSPLAPLHNPLNLFGIRELKKLLPAIPHVAVFDTAFHHSLPAYAYLYGLPYEYYQEQQLRRFGFHGTSHNYVSLKAAQFLKKNVNQLEIISCHLGNGSSVCAIDHGRSIDTSMGFTPAEGLIMGTRSGDIDPGIFSFLSRTKGLSSAEFEEVINKQSGLLGMSGISSDMREVLKAADQGNQRALLALKSYCYRVRKYIGSYVAALCGLDLVVFTGGIGQGSSEVRSLAMQGLECMGIVLDKERNQNADGFNKVELISSDDSKVAVLVVPTNEERMMARDALRAISTTYITKVLKEQKQKSFPVEVSAHHIHLSDQHVEMLFGKGYTLTKFADLSQPGQFASNEQLTVVGPKGSIERVRVLGPTRKNSQVEIAMTEQFKLGLHPPIRESGDIKDTPGCILEGPAGRVTLENGVICALRHIHMTPEDALRYGVRDKSFVRVKIDGSRELIFGDVLVRVHPDFSLAMHIDTDEANAGNVKNGAEGFIVGIQNR